MENHKYKESFENSLILKVFFFRLVTNLTAVFYTAFVQSNLESVKQLIYTLLVMKELSDIGVRFIYPAIKFFLQKKKYFFDVNRIMNKNLSKLEREEEEKKKKQEEIFSLNQEDVKDQLKEFTNKKATKSENFKSKTVIFEKFNNEEELEEKKRKSIAKSMRRLKIISCNTNNQEEININPDAIEMDSFLETKENLVFYYADVIYFLLIFLEYCKFYYCYFICKFDTPGTTYFCHYKHYQLKHWFNSRNTFLQT
jgi:hypothetical protein